MRPYGVLELPLGLVLLPLGLLLPEGLSLELPLVPPGDSAPPVAEPALRPKAEYTLCRQLGCEMSGQLLWLNDGAD